MIGQSNVVQIPKTSPKQRSALRLAKLIQKRRIERGISQADLAQEIGVSLSTVVKWESQLNPTLPSRVVRKPILNLLDIDIDNMIESGELELMG